MFAPVGGDGWPARVRVPAFTLSNEALERAKAKTAQLLRPRTPLVPSETSDVAPTAELAAETLARSDEVVDAPLNAASSATPEAPVVALHADEATHPTPPPSSGAHVQDSVEAGAPETAAGVFAVSDPIDVREASVESAPGGTRTSPPTEPLYLRLYNDAKRIEAQRQTRAKEHKQETRTAERARCTFSPVISPRAQRQRLSTNGQSPVGGTKAPSKGAEQSALDATVLSTGDASLSPSPSPAVSPRKGDHRRQPDERDPSQVVYTRLYSEAARRAESLSKKRAASRKTVEDERGEVCTFRPEISPHARRTHRYANFDDFLTAQDEYRLIRQNQQRRLTQQILEEENGARSRTASSATAGAANLQVSPRARSASAGAALESPVSQKLKAALDTNPRYAGPVSGWAVHAAHYWQSRNGPPSPDTRRREPSPGQGRRSNAVYNRLYKEYSDREAKRQCVALAELEKDRAELFKPRLSCTEALTSRRQRGASHSTADDAAGAHPSPSTTAAETVFDDLYEQGVALQHKKQMQQLSEEEARLSGCSFTPRVNPESERILINLAVKMARGAEDGSIQEATSKEEATSNEEAVNAAAPRTASPATSTKVLKKASGPPSASPQLHLLRLAQYRRQSTSPQAPKPTSESTRTPVQHSAASPSARTGVAASSVGQTHATAAFLERNAALLQRRHDRVAALRLAGDTEDLARCTFRPALAPLTELMADDQQRYLQVVDSPEVRRGSWWRHEGSLSPSVSPRGARPSSRQHEPTTATTAAQKLARMGPTTANASANASVEKPATLSQPATPLPRPSSPSASLTHRPRVIPIAVATPYGTGGSSGSGRRQASERSARSARSGSTAGGSREGTPLRASSRGPAYGSSHRTPLQALAHGAVPVVLQDTRGSWLPAGAGATSSDEDVADAIGSIPGGSDTSPPPVEGDYLHTLETELNATLEKWTGLA